MLDPNLDILVAEDDPVTRRMVCGLLRRLGILNIREVGDGKSALEEIEKSLPHVVITDWGMPKLNGLQLLQTIRHRETLKALPVLMITGRTEKDYVITAIQEGVSSYIVKPFDAKTLEAKISKVLG